MKLHLFDRQIHQIALRRSKRYYIEQYSEEFFKAFAEKSTAVFREIAPKVPDIGKSIFSLNYRFAPAYIAWYKALIELGNTREEADRNIWAMNERLLCMLPRFMLKLTGKMYLNSFRKKAVSHEKRQKAGLLHPYDWRITFRHIDSNTFEIDITECGYLKLAQDYHIRELLPGICRIDYLLSHIMGNGFERTKTLGDGNDCCNCRYHIVGECEWAPEKGFDTRK